MLTEALSPAAVTAVHAAEWMAQQMTGREYHAHWFYWPTSGEPQTFRLTMEPFDRAQHADLPVWESGDVYMEGSRERCIADVLSYVAHDWLLMSRARSHEATADGSAV